MEEVHIFVEGESDITFIKAFIKHLKKDPVTINSLGGWDKLKENGPNLCGNASKGIKNIIICDADGENNGGGYSKRKNKIEDILNKIGIKKYDLFLFPNDKHDGNLETLLEKIINPDHQQILNCFEKYESCIKDAEYKTPDIKSKIYAYITTFFSGNKDKMKEIKKNNWFFSNKEYWNLDALYLNNLKKFLLDVLP